VTIKANDRILINGATGAIGSALLQIIATMDVHITAVGNTKNLDRLKKLGANEVLNYEQEDFTQADLDSFDFIFDAVGKSEFRKCKPLLNPNGMYISSELGPSNENLYLPLVTRLKGGMRVIFPLPLHRDRSIQFMNKMLAEGTCTGLIDKRYEPEQIQEAFSYVLSGQKTGSVLLKLHPEQ